MRWEEEGITSTESDNGAKEILLAGAGEKTNDHGAAPKSAVVRKCFLAVGPSEASQFSQDISELF